MATVTAHRPPRVLLADPDPSTRAGVRLALITDGFTVCAEADSANTAVSCARSSHPDICLLEVALPGGGVSAAESIVEGFPGTVVVMLAAKADEDELLAAFTAGARGYLLKDMDPARLAPTLRGVLAGEVALPRRLMGHVVEALRKRDRGDHDHGLALARLGVELTAREREVLKLLDSGLSTADIAARLAISAVTVRRHVSEVLRKLGAPDREAALGLLRAKATR